MSSGVIQIGQTAISTQAKNTIQDDIDAIIEIITNSADELFGTEFTKFMEGRLDNKSPAIPTITDYNAWKSFLGEKKIGEIIISFRADYTTISDNGGGIPCSYIEDRIKKFGRDVGDQIDMSNNRDFNRRGQFSRGLKEVLAWLHSNDQTGQSSIEIDTIFENEFGKKKGWKGRYIVNPDEDEPYYFQVDEPCHEVEAHIETGTSVTLHYPGEFRIHSSSMLKKLRRHYKLQRIFEEHAVYFNYKQGGKDLIQPYLSTYDRTILFRETREVQIPKGSSIAKPLDQIKSLDYQFHIYRVELEGNSHLRPQYPQSGNGINVRGIYLGDHTTIYGRFMPSDNVLGTENLQAQVIFPALRVFSVIGSSIRDYGLPAFTPSDRKDPNYNHPVIQLIYDDIEETWLEVVKDEAERMKEDLERIEDEKTRLMERSVVRKLNNILNSELQVTADEDRDGSPDPSNSDTTQTRRRKDRTIFGPQLMAYDKILHLSLGRRRRIICYIHDNLVNLESNGELVVETSKPLIINEQKSMRTQHLKIPFGQNDQVANLNRFSVLLQPSLDLQTPITMNIEFKIDLDTIPEKLRKKIENDPDTLSAEFSHHHVPQNLETHDNMLIHRGRINITQQSSSTSGFDYIDQIVFETEDIIEQNNREFPQENLDRGWDITPVPNPSQPDQVNYLFRVYCRSPFFCNTFDPDKILPNQPKDFKTLLSTSLASALAQAVIENSDIPADMGIDVHSEKINEYIPVIKRILTNPDLMAQVI